MKTLRVCLSSDLPGLLDRNPDYLYFLYDKLFLYSGQNMIDVNFVITEHIPDIDDQVPGMIYILNTDGSAFSRPWFGQLMTGPQLMAYLCQVNMWLERYQPKIEI